MKTKITTFIIGFLSIVFLWNTNVFAAAPTDEIINYVITADVNEDASVTLNYHIEWLVLESDNFGPVDWVKIGIPNSIYNDYDALSDNIDSMSISSSGGSYALVYFNDEYYKDETISFDFFIELPNMYRVNKYEEGYTVYSFTPGWFDDIAVDNLTIRWNCDNVTEWTPECFIENGYNEWNASLAPGEKYTIEVTYPNDTYAFDMTRTGDDSDDSELGPVGSVIVAILAMIFVLIIVVVPLAIPVAIIGFIAYAVNGGFGKSYKKEITRTKIEYFPACQGCGAVRKEGEKFCTYCGRSFVKSEEKITESQIPEEEAALRKKVSNGEYRYSSNPNTCIRVNVVRIPVARPVTTTRSRSSGSHSSCAHSSCAHSSCACACACACAGGGRAGCTNKDFYKTNLKLKYLNKKNKLNSHKEM